jgi:hypothetical protein
MIRTSFNRYMKVATLFLIAGIAAACNADNNNFLPAAQDRAATKAGADASDLVLPLEVDIKVAETFVRIGFALDKNQRFQSTEFRTPRLRTGQARHLIQLVKSYNDFEGEKVAAALASFEGRVSGVEFGREGSPVVYIELPYWTHQREGTSPSGMGSRILEEENKTLVQELHKAFVEKLKADEFSVNRRTVRIWWD